LRFASTPYDQKSSPISVRASASRSSTKGKVTFVADVAQFTPKTVETAVEREKLTFRLKAHIPPDLLRKYVKDVKTGLPGVAYVRLDPQAKWPDNLQVRLPKVPNE